MKIIEWKLNLVERKNIIFTIKYIKKITGRSIFTWIPDLYRFEKEILRIFIVIVCYDNFTWKKDFLINLNINKYYANYEKILYTQPNLVLDFFRF
jgi:hypothetical protein